MLGDNKASAVYIRNQKKQAERNGIAFEELELPGDLTREETFATLAQANADTRITGIIIQRPVPEHLDIKEVQQAGTLGGCGRVRF